MVGIDFGFFSCHVIKIMYLVLERFKVNLVLVITIHKWYVDGYLCHVIECPGWFQRLLEMYLCI